jgi:hypothetical protein
MNRKTTSILAASITAALLGLSQTAWASDAAAVTPPTPPAPPAPMAAPEPAAAEASPGSSIDDIIARMEARHQQMIEERERRYEELRSRASELGFEMPEMPPWEPSERAGMPSPDFAPWITDEEREALRLKRWEETRARAAEHGVELPETPPWKAAEERRQAMKERFEKFRATIDELNEEQRKAIEDVIGAVPEVGEMPDFGAMPKHPNMGQGMGPGMGPGMKHGWGAPHRCPHPGKPCNHGYHGPMGAPPMAPPAATAEPAN